MKTMKELLANAMRERKMQDQVYPKRVAAGSLKQEIADHQIACQDGTINVLQCLQTEGHAAVVYFRDSADRDEFIQWTLNSEKAKAKIVSAGALSSS